MSGRYRTGVWMRLFAPREDGFHDKYCHYQYRSGQAAIW